jgi:uncharacterized protein DUF4145
METLATPANVIREGSPVICPHCGVAFKGEWLRFHLANDRDGNWWVRHSNCPTCQRVIITLVHHQTTGAADGAPAMTQTVLVVHPRGPVRAVPEQVPEHYAADYREAALILSDSPKASAALSRRLLQHVLREEGGVKPSDLSREIDEALPALPTRTAQALDAIRAIGNFAAHPTKATNTGEIIEVEEGEAEWSLDVLDFLFDHYFVAPAVFMVKRDALNDKLEAAGKPPLKLSNEP